MGTMTNTTACGSRGCAFITEEAECVRTCMGGFNIDNTSKAFVLCRIFGVRQCVAEVFFRGMSCLAGAHQQQTVRTCLPRWAQAYVRSVHMSNIDCISCVRLAICSQPPSKHAHASGVRRLSLKNITVSCDVFEYADIRLTFGPYVGQPGVFCAFVHTTLLNIDARTYTHGVEARSMDIIDAFSEHEQNTQEAGKIEKEKQIAWHLNQCVFSLCSKHMSA